MFIIFNSEMDFYVAQGPELQLFFPEVIGVFP